MDITDLNRVCCYGPTKEQMAKLNVFLFSLNTEHYVFNNDILKNKFINIGCLKNGIHHCIGGSQLMSVKFTLYLRHDWES